MNISLDLLCQKKISADAKNVVVFLHGTYESYWKMAEAFVQYL